jgi:ubiquinone/menaquinone biosynthesis C-methylase UbiE
MTILTDNMQGHFSQIAPEYNEIRSTDLEPVLFIKEILKSCPVIKAADIGCGAGRYDLLFFEHLKNLHLACVDINESMLRETEHYLKRHGIKNFVTIKSGADDLLIGDDSLDCIFTFNAVHHFDLAEFLKGAERILKRTGLIFIYTRLQSQNAENIWGKCFPMFLEKEKRLYELDEMRRIINSSRFSEESVQVFRYRRNSTLQQLIDRVRSRHYSTFSLYTEKELKDSLSRFKQRVMNNFRDSENIEWFDENILLVLKHKAA